MRITRTMRTRGVTTSTLVAFVSTAVALLAIGFAIGLVVSRGGPEAQPRDVPAAGPQPMTPVDATPGNTLAVAPPGTRTPDVVATRGRPPLAIDPPDIDFGTVQPGETVTGVVSLRNTSNEPLRIVQTKASCKCTSIDLANTVIEPGASVPLSATLDPGYALGNKSAGVKILVEGYDVIQVAVKAEIALAVRADPPYIKAFDDGPDGQQIRPLTTGTVNVLSGDDQPFKVLAVNGAAPLFVDFDPASDSPRNSYEIRWDFSAYNTDLCVDAEGNRLPAFLAVETDHPGCAIFDIQVRHPCTQTPRPVRGQNWLLSERRILVGELAEGESGEFTVKMVWLRRVSPDDSLERVTSDSPNITAELVGVEREADEIRATVRISPAPGFRGLIYDNIRLHSSRHSVALLIVGKAVDARVATAAK